MATHSTWTVKVWAGDDVSRQEIAAALDAAVAGITGVNDFGIYDEQNSVYYEQGETDG